MADKQPFAGLSADENLQAAVVLLAQIVDKMPRVDSFDRMFVTLSDVGTPTNRVDLGSAVAVERFGPAFSVPPSRDTCAIPLHNANSGAEHIYRNIVVT